MKLSEEKQVRLLLRVLNNFNMSIREKLKEQKRLRRKARVRAKISGDKKRPRLSIFRSLKHINAQIIDDTSDKTIVSASDKEIKGAKNKTDAAFKVGELIAQKASKSGISEIVFDKGSSQYHGRVKAVADGARQGGLKF